MEMDTRENVLSFHDVSAFYYRKNKWPHWKSTVNTDSETKQILRNINGSAKSNQLLAIIGSSGVGKSTLLNILTARKMNDCYVTGDIRLNGNQISNRKLINMSAFVQQNNVLPAHLTVKEHLIYSAMLMMSQKHSHEAKMIRIEEIIIEFGLTACANTKIGLLGVVGSISGGERKRLELAAEVLTNPLLMFCDEPTSGLDYFMAQNVISVLKNMVAKGKIVVTTMHQPSSAIFKMFDKIMLMAEGRVAFHGTLSEASEFFDKRGYPCPKTYNPADFYIRTLVIKPDQEHATRKAIVEELCDQFEMSQGGQITTSDFQLSDINPILKESYWTLNTKRRCQASISTQLRTILWRFNLETVRDHIFLKSVLLNVIIPVFVLGAMFFGQSLNQESIMNINGCIVYLVLATTHQSVFFVIYSIFSEREIFYKEFENGMYNLQAYLGARAIAELPTTVVQAMIRVTLTYWLTGLKMEFVAFLNASLIVVMISHISCSFGYIVSTTCSTTATALSFTLAVMDSMLLLSGVFVNVKSAPFWLNWIQYFSWPRNSFEALVVNQWDGIKHIDCSVVSNQTCYSQGNQVIQFYNFDENNFLWNVMILLGQLVLYRFLAYLAFATNAKTRR